MDCITTDYTKMSDEEFLATIRQHPELWYVFKRIVQAEAARQKAQTDTPAGPEPSESK